MSTSHITSLGNTNYNNFKKQKKYFDILNNDYFDILNTFINTTKHYINIKFYVKTKTLMNTYLNITYRLKVQDDVYLDE